MIPVVTAAQMARADAATLADHAPGTGTDHDLLVRRAGAAVAAAAIRMLGGAYGRRVTVVAGKGHNGDDGRVAAERLRDRGAAVTVVPAGDCADLLIERAECDLLIDAAYGTGFRGTWDPPGLWGVPVLAVDLPSGLDADTGLPRPEAIRATVTATMVAPKIGMLAPGAAPFTDMGAASRLFYGAQVGRDVDDAVGVRAQLRPHRHTHARHSANDLAHECLVVGEDLVCRP